MGKIILQPSSNIDAYKHFQDTVQKPVPISSILPHVRIDAEINNIRQVSRNNSVFVWGVTPGKKDANSKKWSRINPGDVTLFYRQGFIFSSAVATYKFHNKELAQFLWGSDENGATWEYIYFIDEIKYHKIPVNTFNQIVGYAPNFIIQGFNVLDEIKSIKVFSAFELTSNQYFPEVSEGEFEEVSSVDLSGPLDAKGLVNVRKEQSFLRANIFKGSAEYKCGICDRLFPINLLVAAHIKKRSECSSEERRDYKNIVMPMCKFGCDDLFEKGYIGVVNGNIQVNTSMRFTTDMQESVLKLHDKQCSHWNQKTKQYFLWHSSRCGISASL
jgi:hypothetical protein